MPLAAPCEERALANCKVTGSGVEGSASISREAIMPIVLKPFCSDVFLTDA